MEKATAAIAGKISSAVKAKKDPKNKKGDPKRQPKKGGNLLGAVGAVVVAGAAVYLGMKLRKREGDKTEEEESRGEDKEVEEEDDSLDSTAEDEGECVLENGDEHDSFLDSEAEELLKKEAEQFLQIKDVQPDVKPDIDVRPGIDVKPDIDVRPGIDAKPDIDVKPGIDVRSDPTGKDPVVDDPEFSTNNLKSPSSATSELRHLQISQSPFNTAPSSPSLFPESPFHDASGELDYEEFHGDSPVNSGRNGEVNSKSFGVSYNAPPADVPLEESNDSNVSAVTSENGERRASISADAEKSQVHALLARARAAAARVEKMHAGINALNKS